MWSCTTAVVLTLVETSFSSLYMIKFVYHWLRLFAQLKNTTKSQSRTRCDNILINDLLFVRVRFMVTIRTDEGILVESVMLMAKHTRYTRSQRLQHATTRMFVDIFEFSKMFFGSLPPSNKVLFTVQAWDLSCEIPRAQRKWPRTFIFEKSLTWFFF